MSRLYGRVEMGVGSQLSKNDKTARKTGGSLSNLEKSCHVTGLPLRIATSFLVTSYDRCPMSQAIVNPEELRRFAQQLKQFNSGLQEQMTALAGKMQSLSTSWRDQENKRFVEEFEQNMKSMARIVEVNDEYIPFLMRKADRIDEYLQQR